jgi:RNA polymerase sigma factor (sigma-70 family)
MELVGQHAHPLRGERVNGSDDQARFAQVVLPHLPDAYALARWLTGSGTDAEDVVQDACLRAFRGIAGFREGNARAWMLTIVRNTAYSWLGRNRPTMLVVTDDVEGVKGAEIAGDDAEAETEMIAKADAARLESAIQKLPAQFRETLVLRDLQGLDYRQIAKVTGAPIGTVMSRLARGRRRLMTMIAKDENDAAA